MDTLYRIEAVGTIEGQEHLLLVKSGDRFFRIPGLLWSICREAAQVSSGSMIEVSSTAATRILQKNKAVKSLEDASISFFELLDRPATRTLRVRALFDFDANVVVRPLAALSTRLPLRILFVIGLALIALNIGYLIVEPTRPSYAQAFQAFGVAKFLLALSVLLFIFLLHELAHCVSAVVFGCRAHRIGFGLLVIVPAFFADVSEIWRLAARKRAAVGVAGLIVQAYAGTILILTAILVPGWGSILEFVALMSASIMLLNMLPFAKLDGYWVISDLLDIKDLRTEVRSRVRSPIRSLRVLIRSDAKERFLIIYSFASVSLMLWFLTSILFWVTPTIADYAVDPYMPSLNASNMAIGILISAYVGIRVHERRHRFFSSRKPKQ